MNGSDTKRFARERATIVSYGPALRGCSPKQERFGGSWGVMTPGLGLCLTIVIELGPVLTEPRMGDPPSPSPTSKAGSECAMTNLYGREKPIL
ncbi:hypothetical protein EVAR_80174_1 [Eumeta japonica]|uniref:Uncharacterized protein n=1 Tax=Eumeta variegata TaxID=151549 RepID=A0A4C1Y936_EUMVA|nr:hypothetical protein EVAR_80174_1 [Eumeta japonica]